MAGQAIRLPLAATTWALQGQMRSSRGGRIEMQAPVRTLIQLLLEVLARPEVEQLWYLSSESLLLFRRCDEARGETATGQDVEACGRNPPHRRLHPLVAGDPAPVSAHGDRFARVAPRGERRDHRTPTRPVVIERES
jgi:hypothetical protein